MTDNAILAAVASRPPQAEVLIGDDQRWRAGALLAAVDELALRVQGCQVLAVLADNGPAWVISDLAALRAGVPQLPLPTFFSAHQLAHLLDQTGADTVLTDQPERIAALERGFLVSGRCCGLICLRRARPQSVSPLPAGTAKISFTSGSTGTPKGACLSAAGLIDTARAVSTRLADLPIARHLAVLPLSLLLENSAGVYAALLRGAQLHLPGLQTLGWQGMSGFDPAALMGSIGRAQASSLILVPELLKAWSLALAAGPSTAPDSLCYVAVGGARVASEAIAAARAVGIPAYQGYGLTECGSVVSLNRPGDDGAAGDDVGRPLDHVRVAAVDSELHVCSRAFLGYVGEPEQARERDTGRGEASSGNGMTDFATGDLGEVDAHGHLRLSGRRKNLLITSFGRNVSPEWVEAALLAQAPILQAIVVGDGQRSLRAVVVPLPGASAAAVADAIAAANASLPDYARIGGWIAASPFSLQNGLATGNGRPLRSAILQRHAEQLEQLFALPPAAGDTRNKEIADVFL